MGRIKTGWTISLKTASECDNTVTRGKDLIPFHASELYEQSGYKYNKCHVKINKLLSIAQHVHMNNGYCTQNPLRNFGEFVPFVSLPHSFFPWVCDLLCTTLHNVRGWLDNNVLLHHHTHNRIKLFQGQSSAARPALVYSPEYNSHQK